MSLTNAQVRNIEYQLNLTLLALCNDFGVVFCDGWQIQVKETESSLERFRAGDKKDRYFRVTCFIGGGEREIVLREEKIALFHGDLERQIGLMRVLTPFNDSEILVVDSAFKRTTHNFMIEKTWGTA